MLEDLVERIIKREEANDGEFGDGGFSAADVIKCKAEIVKLLTAK